MVTLIDISNTRENVVAVPVIWKLYTASGTDPETSTVNVLDAVGTTGSGLNVQVIPTGSPAQSKSTFPLKPAIAVSVVVLVALPPGAAINDEGLDVMEKS